MMVIGEIGYVGRGSSLLAKCNHIFCVDLMRLNNANAKLSLLLNREAPAGS